MIPVKKPFRELVESLPPEWPGDVMPSIRNMLDHRQGTWVVLDDDPTGTQTVHDIPVLMEWSEEALRAEFSRNPALFYILSNSRRYPEKEAVRLAGEIANHLVSASVASGRSFQIISRSDSTLRGHYPAEVDALASALNLKDALQIIMPFFYEGGRLTIDDIHYVRDGDFLIPAAETSFAEDPSFGYHSSDLKEWVREKTLGLVPVDSIQSVTIRDIREGGPDRVKEILLHTTEKVCIINAASMRDAEVVALGLLQAEANGLKFICRTAASIVPLLGGLDRKLLLEKKDLPLGNTGGSLTVVGSYQPRSSAQLNDLLENTRVTPVYLDVMKVLFDPGLSSEMRSMAKSIDKLIREGKDVVLFTTREVMEGKDAESSLEIVGRVSACVVDIVRNLKTRPRYILAKGGITASDIATDALGVKRAEVLGQVLPGVPAWRLDAPSKFGELLYIVFPGNVGDTGSLTRLHQMLA